MRNRNGIIVRYTIPNGSIKSILYTNALIGLSLLWPSHAAHLVTSWSPAPGGWCLVSRDSASVTLTNGLHFPRCPNLDKIRSPSLPAPESCGVCSEQARPLTCIGYIMIIAGPHAGLISKFTCQQPSQETFITITDSWDYPVSVSICLRIPGP